MLRTLAPLNSVNIATNKIPLDLHVLSTPPAFVLSQNQTLREVGDSSPKGELIPHVVSEDILMTPKPGQPGAS